MMNKHFRIIIKGNRSSVEAYIATLRCNGIPGTVFYDDEPVGTFLSQLRYFSKFRKRFPLCGEWYYEVQTKIRQADVVLAKMYASGVELEIPEYIG